MSLLIAIASAVAGFGVGRYYGRSQTPVKEETPKKEDK